MGVVVVSHERLEAFQIDDFGMISFEDLRSRTVTPAEPVELVSLLLEPTDGGDLLEEWNIVRSVVAIFLKISSDVLVDD